MPTAKPDLSAVRAALTDPASIVRAVASGRQRNQQTPWRRVEVRTVDSGGVRLLQVSTYDGRQAHTRNVELADAHRTLDELVGMPFASWFVRTEDEELQARVSKKGKVFVHRAPATGGTTRTHDRVKHRRLDPSDPLFTALGISDADGVLKPSRTDKFKQVQELIAALEPIAGGLPNPARVVDLGCGNAYLTFATHRYLTAVLGRDVHSVGVDVKEQSRDHNERVARELGWADAMTFEVATIASSAFGTRPDLVLSLHACDTASDEAIAAAVRWGTERLLVAPCCHHDIARQLRARASTTALLRYGILRERFADALTDALRAMVLRILGYRVDVVEFVDSAHTPRNTLIRAVRTGAPARPEVLAEYQSLLEQWEVRPALSVMMADELATAGIR
jgi:SAM-dependent methyltransferase